MRVEFINPFITALVSAFDELLQCKITRGPVQMVSNHPSQHAYHLLLGVTGEVDGTIVYGLSQDVAERIASALLDRQVTETEEVFESLATMFDSITTAVREALSDHDLAICRPNIIAGESFALRWPTHIKPLCVPFATPWGELLMEVGLEPVAEFPALSV